ncbi:MAG: DUF1287 domain-containing protein [Luteolibacter sp.]
MPKRKSGFYDTIEYIGPRPQKKPKRQHGFGGWVILAIAAGMGFWFGKPLMNAAPVDASPEQAGALIHMLENSSIPGDRLAAAALAHSTEDVMYDPAYYMIDYPGGDVPPNKGVAADVVVRSFRQLGIDLQKNVHEDMARDFRLYPQLWNAPGPDTNIDHRRVPNLQRYFMRHGETLGNNRSPEEYQPGDIVVWAIANAETHIGIVVPGPGDLVSERWVVHNMGAGVVWENTLFDYQILGHYRYPKSAAAE